MSFTRLGLAWKKLVQFPVLGSFINEMSKAKPLLNHDAFLNFKRKAVLESTLMFVYPLYNISAVHSASVKKGLCRSCNPLEIKTMTKDNACLEAFESGPSSFSL
jgi:hypothetical protein